jgi:hypothetical protein
MPTQDHDFSSVVTISETYRHAIYPTYTLAHLSHVRSNEPLPKERNMSQPQELLSTALTKVTGGAACDDRGSLGAPPDLNAFNRCLSDAPKQYIEQNGPGRANAGLMGDIAELYTRPPGWDRQR